MDDDFAILGITRDATDDQVRKAFRKACLRHHPDKQGDAAQFIRVMEAYRRIKQRGGGGKSKPHQNSTEYAFYTFLCEYLLSWMDRLKRDGEERECQQNITCREATALHVTVPVTIEEIFRGEMKKVVLRMRNADASIRKEALYMDLSDFSLQYIFEKVGDEDAHNNRGDVVIALSIVEHAYAQIVNGDSLRITIPISFYEALVGFEKTIPYLGKTGGPFENLYVRETGPLNACVRKIDGYGLLTADGTQRDPLTVMYQISMPPMSTMLEECLASKEFMAALKSLYPE